MCALVGKAIIVGLFMGIFYPVEGETWWPNFSCYKNTTKNSAQQRRAVSFNRMGWRNCVEKNEKYKEGNCPKVCKLVDERLMYQKKMDGPVIFDTDKFMAHFAEELGYILDKLEVAERQILDKVRSGIQGCKKNNPEYEELKDLKTAKCEPWNKFLQCVDKAIGC